MDRTILAELRRQRETPDTPEQIAARQERIAQMRQVAKEAGTDRPPLLAGGLALIQQMDASRPDHIALAIGAHRLLWLTVRTDLDNIGQPGEDEHPRLITLLILYLDSCGWHWGDGAMEDDHDPRVVAAKLSL